MQVDLLNWIFLLLQIFGGCCSNVWTLEMLLVALPKSTVLITFLQFLMVTVVMLPQFASFRPTLRTHPSLKVRIVNGLLYVFNNGRQGYIPKTVQTDEPLFPYELVLNRTVVPKYHWLAMVSMFWTVSILNNLAFEYQIDMVLHIIFKSSSLLVNMIVGYLVVGKRYTIRQTFAVACVSVGVLLFTFLSSSPSRADLNSNRADWSYGIFLMTISLAISALLSLYQERVYSKYGKQWMEGLFYTHFLGLPFFLLSTRTLLKQSLQLLHSDSAVVAATFINAVTQLICIAGVHRLSSVCASLTVTLTLTFRKFLSLLFSVAYFQKSFTFGHVFGSLLVFSGTLLYATASDPALLQLTFRRQELTQDDNISTSPQVRRSLRKKNARLTEN
eukprot:Partr_v1_DN26319_c2_g1_i4_m43043 putative Solute carrier family 35 member B4